jgi:Sigma-70, region 4
MITREGVQKKLPFIFPVGAPNRNYCVSEIAAGAIFTMLRTGTVNPKHIFQMNEGEASQSLQRKRPLYLTLSRGLIPAGAVKIIPEVRPNAFIPKYFLETAFARLFEPGLPRTMFDAALLAWQKNHFDEKTGRLISVIHAAVESLPPLQKKIFLLTRYENHFRTEAADRLGLSKKTVDNELRNAIRFIREQIRYENIQPDGRRGVGRPNGPRRAVVLAPRSCAASTWKKKN